MYTVVPEPHLMSIPTPQGGLLETPRGGGSQIKGKYEAKLEFPEGWGGGGLKPEKHRCEGYQYFLVQHNV